MEGLCLTNDTFHSPVAPYTTFYHRVSSAFDGKANAARVAGILIWVLSNGQGMNVPSAMSFSHQMTTNVADMIFKPSDKSGDTVSFDGHNSMYMGTDIDDTVSPPIYRDEYLTLKNCKHCPARANFQDRC